MSDDDILRVNAAVDKDEIQLPNTKEGEVTIMMDNGSRPTIANMNKHLPGAALREAEAQREGRGSNPGIKLVIGGVNEFQVDDRKYTRQNTEHNITIIQKLALDTTITTA